ncbi:HAMP domain-containing histidine kinase [Pseudooceanicola sp. CBS1P-1]|uniref:histidine kinase n=1 Tax=Pseudooceanicola albus TaxID=2692189 RepID=A0A6L7FYU6_9RHOB|nr:MULTISPECIES: HAMP domain-containing sensor histidine kinase [Pseudooceanicola]MBT9382363.1 HAMP domain-containing histidine kinase [Pseudooceanicola endophyticus]MXN16905.1 hypothetical protein [Pseudooceanicola albus]
MPDLPTDSPPPTPSSPDSALEEFLYIVTHDLRAGFRAFDTIPDWIREDMGPLPAERRALVEGHLDMLKTQAKRCNRMLLDLRDYSRIGRMADPPEDHPVAALLEAAEQRVPLPDGFTLALHGDGVLTGPANELTQLFAALLSNSLKHHDRAHGQISVTVSGAGPRRRVVFADDGPGIPARLREAVFIPLRTLRPRDDCEGSGMGLTIARKIVQRLGGEIEVLDGGDARGATLVFTLPGHATPRIN